MMLLMHQGRLPLQPVKTSLFPGRGAPPLGFAKTFRGELDEVLPLLPEFDRQPFATDSGAANAFLDVIVRRENSALGLTDLSIAVFCQRCQPTASPVSRYSISFTEKMMM